MELIRLQNHPSVKLNSDDTNPNTSIVATIIAMDADTIVKYKLKKSLLFLSTLAQLYAYNIKIPSKVSINDMPAANSKGKTKIKAGGIVLEFMAVNPNSATSDAVSNPNPNKKPIGYIFQEASTAPNK